MSDPFVGEIRIFAGNFPPKGWAFCEGQILSISQNTALFALLGTTYGGNGQTTFALPDLRDRAPMFFGAGPGLSNYDIGQAGGSPTISLLVSDMPAHNHQARAVNTPGTQTDPTNAVWAAGGGQARSGSPLYSATPGTGGQMAPVELVPAGSSQPHNNRSPYLGVSFIIALQGIFPPRQ